MNFSQEQYKAALKNIVLTPSDIKMLRLNYDAPNHNITASKLAEGMGFKNYNAANLQYGKLAEKFLDYFEVSDKPKFYISVLVDFHRPTKEWHWKMKPELSQALINLEIVTPTVDLQISEELTNQDYDDKTLTEGKTREVKVNIYERNPVARKRCIEHYGSTCQLCGFDFGKVYGTAASGYIHVHHIIPLSEIEGEYEIDPIKDLIPVCPNCHAVIHLSKPHFSIEEMKVIIKEGK